MYAYSGILFHRMKRYRTDACYNMGEPSNSAVYTHLRRYFWKDNTQSDSEKGMRGVANSKWLLHGTYFGMMELLQN